MKFIHTADIHLDSPLHRLQAYEGAPVAEIRQASRRAFENLIDLAVDEAVDFVLIAGDLFDGDWKDYNTGLYFIKHIRRLGAAGIQAFIVSGNHDAAGRMTRSLPYPPNVRLFSERKSETHRLDDLKVAVHGQSFAKVAETDNLAHAYPAPVAGYFNIGLLHTSLTGRPGHEPYAPCALADLTHKGYDYWALGHVHQFEIAAPDPPIVFPGCIQGRHIKEAGAKGCVLVNVSGGAAPEIARHAVDVIRWEPVAVDLAGAANSDALLERCRAALDTVLERHDPRPVVARVAFSGQTALHARLAADPGLLKETVRATAMTHFGDRLWIETVKVRTAPVHRAAADPGPLGELSALVAALLADDAELLALGEGLASLFQRLPPDFRQGETGLRPDDPAQLRELVAQAHALLVQRLHKEADAP